MTCESLSRQALIFNRRQTQHKGSVEIGAASLPHTAQGAGRRGVSAWRESLACSRISLETIVAGTGFFFIPTFQDRA